MRENSIKTALLMLAGFSVALGQASAVPARWLGTWTLSLQESKFGQMWGPGVPKSGLTFTGQTLKIVVTAGHMKITGDTATSELGSIHDESDVDLDRGETVIPGGPVVSFQRIDDASFDVIVSVNSRQLGNHLGENHFAFSPDGKTLTETKTHTEKEVAPEGIDQSKNAVIRTSTTILVFHKTVDAL